MLGTREYVPTVDIAHTQLFASDRGHLIGTGKTSWLAVIYS